MDLRSINIRYGACCYGGALTHFRKRSINNWRPVRCTYCFYNGRRKACITASAVQGKSVSQSTRSFEVGNLKSGPAGDPKEAHLIFDEVFITVKSGHGGNAEIVEAKRGKWVENFKYKPGGNQAKKIWLPASTPGDGADGADVILLCDPEVDNLLHLHERKTYTGRDGSGANPTTGSGGPKRNKDMKKAMTPPLYIRVPQGTVVKRKSTGALLGELINPGDKILVAKGGKGGSGVKAPTREQNIREMRRQYKLAEKTGAEIVAIEDQNWKAETKGLPGQEMGLQLILRVVADVGIVGFPNAGKSSLLAATTRAKPEVAAYPFTTLMPNLGVLSSHVSSSSPSPSGSTSANNSPTKAQSSSSAPVLADLPGLIEGAHMGKGLGRMFLRHLRRTRALLHVVDAAAADPATDYYAVREELRMYNPEYCSRPHVVALNKMDIEDAGSLREELTGAVSAAAERLLKEWEEAVAEAAAEEAADAQAGALKRDVEELPSSSGSGGRVTREGLETGRLSGMKGKMNVSSTDKRGAQLNAKARLSSGRGSGKAALCGARSKTGGGKLGAGVSGMHSSKSTLSWRPNIPVAIVPCSALTGEGLEELQAALRKALELQYQLSSQDRQVESRRQPQHITVQGGLTSHDHGDTSIERRLSEAGISQADAEEGESADLVPEEELSEEERWLIGLTEEQLAELEAADASSFEAEPNPDGTAWSLKYTKMQAVQEQEEEQEEDEEGVEDEAVQTSIAASSLSAEEVGDVTSNHGDGSEAVEVEVCEDSLLTEQETGLMQLSDEELLALVQD